MSTSESGALARRTRREPPPFRRVTVRRVERLTPRLLRVTFAGADLDGLVIDEPAASVRLLLPSPGTSTLVVPAWNGNEFLLPDGRRPTIRTFTPRRLDTDALTLDLEIVVHGGGAASTWAASAGEGDAAAISGPGRGYTIDTSAPAFVVAGDETAIPAVSQLLEVLPADVPVRVVLEVAHPDARLALPERAHTRVEWHDLPEGAVPGDALVDALQAVDVVPDARVWVAGEAAAMQRIRRYFFDALGVPRARTTIRGYWKRGRAGDADAGD